MSLKLPCLINPIFSETVPNGKNYNNEDSGGTNSKHVVRNVLVQITGNRASWETHGVYGAVWRVNTERANAIFGTDADVQHSEAVTHDRLRRALLKKVTVLESNSSVDDVVAVVIEGLPPKEFSAHGNGASIFLTGKGRVTEPQEVFCLTGNTEMGMRWMRQYPQYTSENIFTEGVITITGNSFNFVHEKHPVVDLMIANEAELGTHICPQALMEGGGWYRVDREMLLLCLEQLQETIVLNTPATFDLTTLTVRVTPPDGETWLKLSSRTIDTLVPPEITETNDEDAIEEYKAKSLATFMDAPQTVTLRLAFEYVLPDASSATAAPPMMMQPSSAAVPPNKRKGG